MKGPSLNDLPSPPPGKTGWPWTEARTEFPPNPCANRRLPTISIVTATFNQGNFIEHTIRSIVLQGYPDLEYIVIDGGSTDGTQEIIEKYRPFIAHYVSESDDGQYDAINKGFA